METIPESTPVSVENFYTMLERTMCSPYFCPLNRQYYV